MEVKMLIVGSAGLAAAVGAVLVLLIQFRSSGPSRLSRQQVYSGLTFFWFGLCLALSAFFPNNIVAYILRVITLSAGLLMLARLIVERVRESRIHSNAAGRAE